MIDDIVHEIFCKVKSLSKSEILSASHSAKVSVCTALGAYSEEWRYLVENFFRPKCDVSGYCTEKKSCGRKPGSPQV